MKRHQRRKRRRTRQRYKPRHNSWGIARDWWKPVIVIGGVALWFMSYLAYALYASFSGIPYRGDSWFNAACFAAGGVGMLSWLPHMLIVDDGNLPKFDPERNTRRLFWLLVIGVTASAILVALGPILTLAAGYRFTDWIPGPFCGKHGGCSYAPLWALSPMAWGMAAVILYFPARAVWKRVTHSGNKRAAT